MLAWLCARIRLLSWWAASWPPTNVAACDKGTGTSQRVARIQELVSVRNWLARDQGTALAISRSGNRNWPAWAGGTALASARPGNSPRAHRLGDFWGDGAVLVQAVWHRLGNF